MPQQAPPPIVRKWFQPGEGIAREVITADIQRYLGPDALVKPGIGQDDMQVRCPCVNSFFYSSNSDLI